MPPCTPPRCSRHPDRPANSGRRSLRTRSAGGTAPRSAARHARPWGRRAPTCAGTSRPSPPGRRGPSRTQTTPAAPRTQRQPARVAERDDRDHRVLVRAAADRVAVPGDAVAAVAVVAAAGGQERLAELGPVVRDSAPRARASGGWGSGSPIAVGVESRGTSTTRSYICRRSARHGTSRTSAANTRRPGHQRGARRPTRRGDSPALGSSDRASATRRRTACPGSPCPELAPGSNTLCSGGILPSAGVMTDPSGEAVPRPGRSAPAASPTVEPTGWRCTQCSWRGAGNEGGRSSTSGAGVRPDAGPGIEPGSPAPSERVLVHRFGVARMTVRQAMDALVVRGAARPDPRQGHVRRPPAARVERHRVATPRR